jgi:hypothetical protein
MKMFSDYYEEDYDPIEEYESGIKILSKKEEYREDDYERGVKLIHIDEDYDRDDDYEPCIRHFKD